MASTVRCPSIMASTTPATQPRSIPLRSWTSAAIQKVVNTLGVKNGLDGSPAPACVSAPRSCGAHLRQRRQAPPTTTGATWVVGYTSGLATASFLGDALEGQQRPGQDVTVNGNYMKGIDGIDGYMIAGP